MTTINPRARVVFLAAMIMVCSATRGAAQDAPKVFAGGALAVTMERGASDPPYLSPGLSGVAPAGTLTVALGVSSRIAFGIEVSVARAFTQEQRGRISGGTAEYQRTHRDTILSAIGRYWFSPRWAGVIGLSRFRTETSEVSILNRHLLNPPRVEGPFVQKYEEAVLGVVAGVDYTLEVWQHFGVVPSIRFHVAEHGEEPIGLGIDVLVIRPAIGIEVRF